MGKGKQGDELPAELARRESRLKKIAEAKAALEPEARERACQEKGAGQKMAGKSLMTKPMQLHVQAADHRS